MKPERSMLRVRLLAFGVLAATFAAGAIGGMAFERTRGPDAPPPGPRAAIFAGGGQLAERLDLTPEQVQRIEAILAADRAKARATFDEMEPRLRARFDSTRAAIEAVLTAEQRDEFRNLQEERRRGLRIRFGGPPPRGEWRGERPRRERRAPP